MIGDSVYDGQVSGQVSGQIATQVASLVDRVLNECLPCMRDVRSRSPVVRQTTNNVVNAACAASPAGVGAVPMGPLPPRSRVHALGARAFADDRGGATGLGPRADRLPAGPRRSAEVPS